MLSYVLSKVKTSVTVELAGMANGVLKGMADTLLLGPEFQIVVVAPVLPTA